MPDQGRVSSDLSSDPASARHRIKEFMMNETSISELENQKNEGTKAMVHSNRRFPRKGRRREKIVRELEDRRRNSGDMAWNSTRNLKASYSAGDDLAKVSWDAYSMFQGDNLLYGGILFPSLPAVVDDVVAMTLELVNAPEGAGGTFTSGGTESILIAVRAALKWARENRPKPGTPEIVAPCHLHPAFNKAADMMGLKVVAYR